jgi:hypothetical protein
MLDAAISVPGAVEGGSRLRFSGCEDSLGIVY